MMMKRSKLWLPLSAAALAGGLVLYAAQAPAAPTDEPAAAEAPAKAKSKAKRCLTGGNYEQTIVDDSTLILTDRFSTAVKVKVKVKGCHLNDMDPLMFEFRGTTQVCDPIDLDMSTISSPGFKSKCFVQSVTPVATDEG